MQSAYRRLHLDKLLVCSLRLILQPGRMQLERRRSCYNPSFAFIAFMMLATPHLGVHSS